MICDGCGQPLGYRDENEWGDVEWFHSESHRDNVAEARQQEAYR